MLICVTAVNVSAASTAVISADSVEAYAGNSVQVNVYLDSNPGITYLKLRVSYDSSALTLFGATNGTVIDDMTIGNAYVWSTVDASTETGKLASLIFIVNADAPAGDYPITITCSEASNDEYDVPYRITNGNITVPCVHEMENVSYTPATCEKTGKRIMKCSICGTTETVTFDKVSCSPLNEATCTEDSICEYCEDVLEEAYGHKYRTQIFEPTVGAQGYTLHTCMRCSETYTDNYIPPIEDHVHSYAKSSTVTPSCTKEGYTLYVCDDCSASKKENITAALGHSYTSSVVAPTCSSNGYTLNTCSRCHDQSKSNYVATVDHEYQNGTCVYCGAAKPLYDSYSDIGIDNCSGWYSTDYNGNTTSTLKVSISNFGTKASESYTLTVRINSPTGQIVFQNTFDVLDSGESNSITINDLDVSKTYSYFVTVETTNDKNIANNYSFAVISQYYADSDHYAHPFDNFVFIDENTHTATCYCGETLTHSHWYPYVGARCVVCAYSGLKGCDLSIEGSGLYWSMTEGIAGISAEIKNLGTETASSYRIIIRKDAPNGEIIFDNTLYNLLPGESRAPSIDVYASTTATAYYIYLICDNDIDSSNNYKLIVISHKENESWGYFHDYIAFTPVDENEHQAYCSNNCGNFVELTHWYATDTSTECVVCGFEREAPTHTHSFSLWTEHSTTQHKRTCSCGEIEYANHTWDVGVITKEPSCLEQGIKTYTCSVCNSTKTDTLPTTGHSIKYIAAKEPTCTTCGNVEYWFCEDCGYAWLDEELTLNTALKYVSLEPAHQLVNVPAKSPTTTQNGNIEYWYCQVCGSAWLDEKCTLNTNLKAVILPASGLQQSDGLEYQLNEDGKSYTVIGLGSCIDLDVVIPDLYNGLPITGIGANAFAGSNITGIYIPSTIKTIGKSAFSKCKNLQATHIDSLEAWFEIEFASGFSNPIWQYGNLYIGGELLTELVIPKSVTKINAYAFYQCTSLVSVNASNVITINAYAFYGCGNLTSVVLNPALTTINKSTFGGCYSLRNITLPEALKTIGMQAFSNSGLETIHLPANLTTVGRSAFSGTDNLKNITVDKNNSCFEIVDNCLIDINHKELTFAWGDFIIPNDGRVINISAGAFFCSDIESLVLPEGIVKIRNNAFDSCKKLTVITVPVSVTEIEKYAFAHCTELQTLIYQGTEEQWASVTKGTDWNLNSQFTITFTNDHTHSFSAWIFYSAEQHKRTCSCGKIEYAEHTWDNGVITTPPTYTTGGVMTYTCSECKERKLEFIPTKSMPDVNTDGVVDEIDAETILKYITGYDVEADKMITDINGDGEVNIRDAAMILLYLKDKSN